MPEVRCDDVENCGRYFDVDPDDVTDGSVRCPYCGTATTVSDAGGTDAGASAASSETHITAEGPTTVRITIEIEPGTGGDR